MRIFSKINKIELDNTVYYIPENHSVNAVDYPSANDLLLSAELVIENNKVIKNRNGKLCSNDL